MDKHNMAEVARDIFLFSKDGLKYPTKFHGIAMEVFPIPKTKSLYISLI